MSSSDPISNLESLNISSESMDVPAVVGEAFQRSSRSASSTPLRARSKTTQSGGSGRKPVSTIMKALPRASQSRGPSPSHRGQGSVGVDVPVEVHHHQEFHVHDGRTQTITMGVDPVEYGRMVGEAGWGVVCARQKWVVCARQTLVVCARYFCVILSLYLCNMILLVAVFSLHHHTTHHSASQSNTVETPVATL